MQPINYMQGYQNPLEKILNQVKMYQDYSQNANVLQSQKEQNRLTTAHNDRRIEAMNALKALDFGDEGKLRQWAGRYGDLEYGKGVQDYLSTLSEQERQAKIGQLSQLYSALANDEPQVAYDFLQKQAQAYENAGNSDEAEDLRYMANLIQTNPQTALQSVALAYANIAPKEGMENYKTLIDSQKHDMKTLDMGDRVMGVIQDPWGNFEKYTIGDKGVSPDTVANNDMRWKIAEMEEQGRNARSDADREADFIKHQNQMIYEAQKERMKSGQVMTNTEGYQMIYYPDGRAEYVVDPDGNRVMGQAGGGSKLLNESQSNAFNFGSRMLHSNKIIADLEGEGVKMNWGQLQLDKNSWMLTRSIVNLFSNPKQQQYAQAVDDFINAVLRKESGAAIGADEYKGALRQYFPMPGDDKKTIEQKAKNREIALRGVLASVPDDYLREQGIVLDDARNTRAIASKYITGL